MKNPWIKSAVAAAAIGLSGCLVIEEKHDQGSAVVELSGAITANTTLKAGQDYLLTGQTFVKSGVTLTIEPGVTIKGLPYDSKGQASVLVVERGAYLIAEGTREKPITFTTAFEPDEMPGKRGLWGGLILLGSAPINQEGGEAFIEGLAGIPFGGSKVDDSSGVLKFVRVWHGGRSIGEGNEINGVTFGGVGNRTVVENVEVAWNNDDGFEFFGGTVNAKYLSALFVGDDAFDMDWGYQGKLQHLFALFDQTEAGRGMEIDNDGNAMDVQPRTYPKISNVTLIGSNGGKASGDNTDNMIRLREGTGGEFRNLVVLKGNGVCLRVSDAPTLALFSQKAPTAPNALYVSPYSLMSECVGGALHKDVAKLGTVDTSAAQLRVLTMEQGMWSQLDPRPRLASPVWTVRDTLTGDAFFDAVDYSGAFGKTNWLEGWSWLSENKILTQGAE
jgi:hypothetical protein